MNKTGTSAELQLTPGTLPAGFRYAGIPAGIKPSGNPDVSLIVAEKPVVVAGVYTQNQIVAAPVVLCRERTPGDSIRAVITNSGNANACTGPQGMSDAMAMCREVALRVGCDESDVLVMSTGVIGQELPMDLVSGGIRDAFESLGEDLDAFTSAAEAIRTTDKERKVAGASFQCAGKTIRIAAMAKGAGMISPNMATMLAVVMTDACLDPSTAQSLLQRSADASFNRVSVDQHTSTNDTLLLMCSGKDRPLGGDDLGVFAENLNRVCVHLAKQLVADGEGAQRFMAIHVSGAGDDDAANRIAKAIGDSPLVKTAITGCDPNWGRIVSAAGYADAQIIPDQTTLRLCGETIYENGTPCSFDQGDVSTKMRDEREVVIDLQVGTGSGKATRWASDLTTDYVSFNSEYTT